MPECFDVAALRHFRDGGLLRERQSLDNADQLFGFAAECAIKSALVTLPGCLQGGDLAQKYREHVDRLWDLAVLQGLQKRYPGLLVVLRGLQQPFADWSASQRYGPDGAIATEVLDRHREAAKRVLGSVGLNGQRER
ncbi:MAG TPA: hypothetical protein VKM72_34315 [Thermoanaerobaculia bacterium]|nr:hypothetical protein [Thermoanaerobaculia bacterium]